MHPYLSLLALCAATTLVASAHAADHPLIGVVWQLQSIEDASGQFAPDDPSRYTLMFEADGRLIVQADCNRGAGRYLQEGDLLTTTVAYTRALCPPESLFDLFTQKLEATEMFVLETDTLTLRYASGVMTFGVADATDDTPDNDAPDDEADGETDDEADNETEGETEGETEDVEDTL